MLRGDHAPTPLARFGDSQGTIIFGWAAPQVLYSRLDGVLSDSLAATYCNRIERTIWSTSGEVRFFSDLWQLENYAVGARDQLVRVLQAHRKRFVAIDVLVRSTVVTLGARAAAIILGGHVGIHTRPAEFMARLQSRSPHLRALLEPAISPRPQDD